MKSAKDEGLFHNILDIVRQIPEDMLQLMDKLPLLQELRIHA